MVQGNAAQAREARPAGRRRRDPASLHLPLGRDAMDDTHTISAGGIAASIKADGAELCSLKAADGLELLWQAGPAWPRHAPWLFPIVGRLANDDLRHGA